MGNNCKPDETDDLSSMDSYKEMEQRLNALRSLVRDLLIANQELRNALLSTEAKCSSPKT